MNEDPDNLSNNQALDKLDPVFLEAHSVHSEIYHSTVQVPGNPQTSNQNSPNQNNQINPEIHSGFLANKPGSQIKDPSENPSTLMQREQLNEDSTNCADTVCLVVAVLVVLTSMIGFIVILTKGTVNELVVVDSDGNRCGGSSLENYPYLYMNNTKGQISSGVCLSQCPNQSFPNPSVYSEGNVTYYDTVGYENPNICLPLQESLLEIMEINLKYNDLNVIVDEFQESVSFYLYVMGLSVAVGLILLLIIRVFKKVSIYILLFMTIMISMATGVLMIIYSAFYNENSEDSIEINVLETFWADLNYFSGYFILGILLIIYSVYWIFKTVVYWKSGELDKLSKLIKTAKDINKQYKFLVAIGLFSYLSAMLFLAFLIIFFVYLVPLYSSPSFSFIEISTDSSTGETIVYKLMAYFAVPINLWFCSSFLSFSQFSLAVLSVAKYFPPVNPTVTDHKTRIFTNKLNYHIGSIFLAGFGNLLIFFVTIFTTIVLVFLIICSKFCPKLNSIANSIKSCSKKLTEKLSGNGFIIIALRNASLVEANDLVSKFTAKNQGKYPLEGNTGDLIGILCGSIVFCGGCLLGLGLLIGNVDFRVSFLPILSFAGMGYFCGAAMSEQYWYEINVIYLLFCICEEVLGRREENQYNYENQIVHSKINDIGGIYSIIKISRENEQFSQNYNQMQ